MATAPAPVPETPPAPPVIPPAIGDTVRELAARLEALESSRKEDRSLLDRILSKPAAPAGPAPEKKHDDSPLPFLGIW